MFSPSVSERVAADAQAALKVREHTGPVRHVVSEDCALDADPPRLALAEETVRHYRSPTPREIWSAYYRQGFRIDGDDDRIHPKAPWTHE